MVAITTLISAAVSAYDLLNNFTNVDQVAIFDSKSLKQIFMDARPIKAEVRPTSTIMKHPAETGVKLSDHKIINQNEINMLLFISAEFYNSVYVQIRNAYLSSTLLSVQTRTGVYKNMIIVDMPHEEKSEAFDAVTMGLRLEEVIFAVPNSVTGVLAPANFVPVDAPNSDTKKIGQKYSIATSLLGIASAAALLKRI